MARPSKYTYKQAAKLSGACVYVFLGETGPVYVGKTTNIRRRFEPYTAGKCHNVALSKWLQQMAGEFDVLIYRAADIDSLECELIAKHKAGLFNLSNGKENDWYTQNAEQKPWVAGRGILSPISDALRKMGDGDKKSAITSWLGSLSDSGRCVAEVQTAALVPLRYRRWLDLTQSKLIACMEAA